MFIRHAARALPALALASACARNGGANARTTPIPVDVAAELRVVRGESTWVARGPGYELIARSRRDLGFVEPAVDREIASFRRVFPTDTTTVVATVRPAPVSVGCDRIDGTRVAFRACVACYGSRGRSSAAGW
jgi:hypothetical protein